MAGSHYTSGDAVTPNDATILRGVKGLYVGGTGNVKVDMKGVGAGATLTFSGVPAGTILPIEITKVYATGTTATLMNALR